MNKKLIEDILQSDLLNDFIAKSSGALENYNENDSDEELCVLIDSIIQKLSSGFDVIYLYELERTAKEIKFELDEIKRIQKSINKRKNTQEIDEKLEKTKQKKIKLHIKEIIGMLNYLIDEEEDEEYDIELEEEEYKTEYDSDDDDDGPYCYACQESPCMCSDPERTSTVW